MDSNNKCLKCNIEKLFNEFHKKSDAKKDINNICKSYKKIMGVEYNKKYYSTNFEIIKIKRHNEYK